MKHKTRPLKTLQTEYVVEINGQPVKVFNENNNAKTNLKLARKFVRNLKITNEVETVSVSKITINKTIIETYKPEIKTVLTINDLDLT